MQKHIPPREKSSIGLRPRVSAEPQGQARPCEVADSGADAGEGLGARARPRTRKHCRGKVDHGIGSAESLGECQA